MFVRMILFGGPPLTVVKMTVLPAWRPGFTVGSHTWVVARKEFPVKFVLPFKLIAIADELLVRTLSSAPRDLMGVTLLASTGWTVRRTLLICNKTVRPSRNKLLVFPFKPFLTSFNRGPLLLVLNFQRLRNGRLPGRPGSGCRITVRVVALAWVTDRPLRSWTVLLMRSWGIPHLRFTQKDRAKC